MLAAGHYLQQVFEEKFGYDLKEHLEIIILGIVLITTAPVIYKLFVGTDWSALITDGMNPDPLAEWPHSTLARINADQKVARVPWRYDAMIAHPLDIWRLKSIYLKDAGTAGVASMTSDQSLGTLSMKLGLRMIIEDNTGGIPRGRPILFSQGNVGGTAWERPIKTEIVPERRRLRDVVQCTGSAAYFVDNPFALLQLTGVATADGGT